MAMTATNASVRAERRCSGSSAIESAINAGTSAAEKTNQTAFADASDSMPSGATSTANPGRYLKRQWASVTR